MPQPTSRPATWRLEKSRPSDPGNATAGCQPPVGLEAERRADGRAVPAAWLLFAILLAPTVLSLLIAEAAAHLH